MIQSRATLRIDGEDTRPDSMYNENELKIGINIEKEHSINYNIAKRIAKDHLDEFPFYYSGLVWLEKRLAEGWLP